MIQQLCTTTLLICLLFNPSGSAAQEEYDADTNAGSVLLAGITYGGHIPGGDLADRYGNAFDLGLELDFITQNNLIFGLESALLFGRNVKEDVLANLRTPDGGIIGNTRSYANVVLRERGLYIGGLAGKLISLSQHNKRSGIRLTLGLGMLQHKIRIQDDPQSFVPQLDSEYKKGYDRLSNGLALTQYIGYQLLSTNRLVNFHAGLEFRQAFTKSRRDFNFDTRSIESDNRLDLTFGFKVGWFLPFYIGQADTIYY